MAFPIWMAESISVTGLCSSHSSFLILYPRLYWNSSNSLWSCPVQTSQLPACGERRRWNGPARDLGDCLPVYLSMASLFWWDPSSPGLSASQFPFCVSPLFSQYLFMIFFLFPVSLQALWSVASWKLGISLTQNVMHQSMKLVKEADNLILEI